MNLTATQCRAANAVKFHADCHGIYFHEAHLWLPNKVRDWPQVRIVRDSKDYPILDEFRTRSGFWLPCWLCDKPDLPNQIHHIVGGAHRSDEFTNLTLLCSACHRQVQSQPKELPRVLLAKWTHDRMNTSWVRLMALYGRKFDFDLPEADA